MTNPTKAPQSPTSRRASRGDDTYVSPRRLRTPRLAELVHELRETHWLVLELLSTEPFLATRHICALLFTEGTKLSAVRICRRTLRELHQKGVLHRERPVPAKAGGGSEDMLWALTAAGQRLLALRKGEAPRRLRRPQERGTSGRRHLLAIADLRVALAIACREQGRELRWVGEPACWWSFRSAHGTERLKPDGYVEVATPEQRTIAWLELDIGTQSVRGAVTSKLRRYCRAARARVRQGVPVPRVIVVSEAASRRALIARAVDEVARKERLAAETAVALFSVADRAAAVRELVG